MEVTLWGVRGSIPTPRPDTVRYGGNTSCAEVAAAPNSTVILFDQVSFQNLEMWQSFRVSALFLASAYNTLYDKSLETETDRKEYEQTIQQFSQGMSWAGATEFGALSGLVTALGATTANNASTFTIQDSTVAVSLAHQLQRCQPAPTLVYYPLFGSSVNPDRANLVTDTLSNLNKVRKKVQDQVLKPQLIPTQSNPNPQKPTPVPSTDAKFTILQDLNTQYDQLFTSLLAPSVQASGATVGTAPAGITSVVQGADLENRLQQPNTYVLYANVVAAGGTQIDRKNLLTVLFTGDWISYSGGVVVNVALTKSDDNLLVFADTLRYRTAPWLPFATMRHPKQAKNVEDASSGDNALSLFDETGSRPLAQLDWAEATPTEIEAGKPIHIRVGLTAPPQNDNQVSLSPGEEVTDGVILKKMPKVISVPPLGTVGSVDFDTVAIPNVSTATIVVSYHAVSKKIQLKVKQPGGQAN